MDSKSVSVRKGLNGDSFVGEAHVVLRELSKSFQILIENLPTPIRRATELRRALHIDHTLSWQAFTLATGREPMKFGAVVPGSQAARRFLEAAFQAGASKAFVEQARSAYGRFEELVDRHAGDRTSFNSMVSSIGQSKADDSVDLLHRRNIYRGCSHFTGLQALTQLGCLLLTEQSRRSAWDVAVIGGFVGLRCLRQLASVQVYRSRIFGIGKRHREKVRREPLRLGKSGGGYLLDEFSIDPVPKFKMHQGEAGLTAAELINPGLGNSSAQTLMFATVYRNHPVPGAGDIKPQFLVDMVVDKPVEIAISDLIVKPGLMRKARPIAEVFLGRNLSDETIMPGHVVPLQRNPPVELIGRGPSALATPDVPNYPDMVSAAARKLDWDISEFEIWRIKIAFPIYSATIRMRFDLPPIR